MKAKTKKLTKSQVMNLLKEEHPDLMESGEVNTVSWFEKNGLLTTVISWQDEYHMIDVFENGKHLAFMSLGCCGPKNTGDFKLVDF